MVKKAGFIIGPLSFISIWLLSGDLLGTIALVSALTLWMIIWWVTEAVPIPVTALLPIVLLPITGTFSIAEACSPYASPIIFLFMGGFMIALGLEKHNLHVRFALNILKVTGSSGNGIILGFMIATASLSMWISNTATAVMMLPIATSVVQLLSTKEGFIQSEKTFALSLMLCIAFAANIGGTITLIGTPPNVVMAGYVNQFLEKQIAFTEWMLIAAPIGLLLLAMTYLLLVKFLFRNSIKEVAGSAEMINQELSSLGRVTKEELLVIIIFLVTAFGWVFKAQINHWLGAKLLTDHITAMAGGILMFSIPVHFRDYKKLMDWEDTKKLPWGILILFGGGMSLAKALAHVGIIDYIGVAVSRLQYMHPFFIILSVTAIVLFMTEVMSNVALVTILIPVIIAAAGGLGIEPLLLVIPATLALSCAFMMPISTPPNAIVFSSGHITMKQMMKAGVWLNILSVALLSGMSYYLVPLLF